MFRIGIHNKEKLICGKFLQEKIDEGTIQKIFFVLIIKLAFLNPYNLIFFVIKERGGYGEFHFSKLLI